MDNNIFNDNVIGIHVIVYSYTLMYHVSSVGPIMKDLLSNIVQFGGHCTTGRAINCLMPN